MSRYPGEPDGDWEELLCRDRLAVRALASEHVRPDDGAGEAGDGLLSEGEDGAVRAGGVDIREGVP